MISSHQNAVYKTSLRQVTENLTVTENQNLCFENLTHDLILQWNRLSIVKTLLGNLKICKDQ